MGDIVKTSASITIKKADGTTSKKNLTNLNPNCTDRQIWYGARSIYSLTKNEIKGISKTQELNVDYEGGESIDANGGGDFVLDDKLDMSIVGNGGENNITLGANFSRVNLNNANSYIYNTGSYNTITTGQYSGDTIINTGSNNSINAGFIHNDDKNIIYSTGDNNTLGAANFLTVTAEGNNQVIYNAMAVTLCGDNSSIKTWNTTLANASITGNNNTLRAQTTVKAEISGDDNNIFGSSNADSVTITGDNNSINAAQGNDKIYVTDTGVNGNVFVYPKAISNGADTIYNFNSDKDILYFDAEPNISLYSAAAGTPPGIKFKISGSSYAATVRFAESDVSSVRYRVGDDPEVRIYTLE